MLQKTVVLEYLNLSNDREPKLHLKSSFSIPHQKYGCYYEKKSPAFRRIRTHKRLLLNHLSPHRWTEIQESGESQQWEKIQCSLCVSLALSYSATTHQENVTCKVSIQEIVKRTSAKFVRKIKEGMTAFRLTWGTSIRARETLSALYVAQKSFRIDTWKPTSNWCTRTRRTSAVRFALISSTSKQLWTGMLGLFMGRKSLLNANIVSKSSEPNSF